jgi:hypothetical protein
LYSPLSLWTSLSVFSVISAATGSALPCGHPHSVPPPPHASTHTPVTDYHNRPMAPKSPAFACKRATLTWNRSQRSNSIKVGAIALLYPTQQIGLFSTTSFREAERSTLCPAHFALAATHDLGLAALYPSRSCARGPLLVINHRIMLDVESVPGPSLLTHLVLLRNKVSWVRPNHRARMIRAAECLAVSRARGPPT